MWGETTRVENRGETTRGGNVLGAKRLVTKNKTGKLDHSSKGPEMVIDRKHPRPIFRKIFRSKFMQISVVLDDCPRWQAKEKN